jgi:hypothetical protein
MAPEKTALGTINAGHNSRPAILVDRGDQQVDAVER